jgi:hypothetical protein
VAEQQLTTAILTSNAFDACALARLRLAYSKVIVGLIMYQLAETVVVAVGASAIPGLIGAGLMFLRWF